MKEQLNLSLGKETTYSGLYDRDLLVSIPRKLGREQVGMFKDVPFSGGDFWNC